MTCGVCGCDTGGGVVMCGVTPRTAVVYGERRKTRCIRDTTQMEGVTRGEICEDCFRALGGVARLTKGRVPKDTALPPDSHVFDACDEACEKNGYIQECSGCGCISCLAVHDALLGRPVRIINRDDIPGPVVDAIRKLTRWETKLTVANARQLVDRFGITEAPGSVCELLRAILAAPSPQHGKRRKTAVVPPPRRFMRKPGSGTAPVTERATVKKEPV